MPTVTPTAGTEIDAAPEPLEIGRGLTTLVGGGNPPRGRERFAAVAGMALDRASYSVLFRLEEGPARLSDLAHKVGVDISTLSRQVHHLEASGLVGRRVVEEDRRAGVPLGSDQGAG